MAGKKTGKRLLTWVLVLVMALSLLPLNALAAEADEAAALQMSDEDNSDDRSLMPAKTTYTITFDASGGKLNNGKETFDATYNSNNAQVKSNDVTNSTILDENPSNPPNVFQGWFYKQFNIGIEKEFKPQSTKVNDVVGAFSHHGTIYAKWKLPDGFKEATIFYLKTPTSNPKSNDNDDWNRLGSVNAGTVDLTGFNSWEKSESLLAPLVRNCYEIQGKSDRVTLPDGYGSLVNGELVLNPKKSDWSTIFDAFKSDTGIPDLTKDDVTQIILKRYKVSKNNIPHTGSYHVDCEVEIQCKEIFTVKFFFNNGTTTDQLKPMYCRQGNSINDGDIPTTNPAPEGYEFDGWYTSNNFDANTKVTFPLTPNANVDLYARYKAIETPNPELPTPATVTLSDAEGYSLIKKHLTVNGDGLAEDTYFVAKLEAVNDLAKGVLSDSLSCSTSYKTATGNDVFTFNDTNDSNILTFSDPGEYTFKVTEENLGVKYMQYDDTVYTMTVNVTKDATENKLNAAVSFKNGDDPVNEGYITFNNTYTAPAYPVYVYAFFAHNGTPLKGNVTVNGNPIEWNEDANNEYKEYFVTLGVYPNGTTKKPTDNAMGLDLDALKGKEYEPATGDGSGTKNSVTLDNITNYPSPYGKVCKGAAGYPKIRDELSWHLEGQVNVYTVTYDYNGGTAQGAHTSNGYYFGSYPIAAAPKRDGYTFTGWKDGDTTYPTNEEITLEKDLKLVANWEKDESQTQKTSYTVQHKVDGKIIDKDTQTYTNTAWINETDPTIAIVSGSLSPKSYDGYEYVGMEPETITDTVASGTIITLTYEKRTDLSYTVHYYLKGTTKKVANDKTVDGQTFNAVVKEEAIRISGYRVYGNSVKSITIGTGTNEIIFYYPRASRPSTPSKPTLNTGDHYAYVMGYPDGTVRPNGSITRAEVSAILFRLLSDKTRDEYFTTESSFTDVKAGAWYNNSIATLEKAGVIVDTAKGGAFRPNEAITRAELAAMLAQFSDAKPVKGVKFSDVPAEHWAYEAIAIAAKMGWIEGYPDGTFRPDATITRAEMMTLVNRALERVPSDEDHLLSKRVMLTFPDCKSGDWFYIAVQEATNSHTYERAATEKNGDEQWTALRANRDWTLLEK